MNILLIMTDQQHKYALGAVSPFVKTPNLDKLAEKGTLFTNCYSNNPVCTPFRGVLYSGCYSKDTGVMKNNDYLCSSEITLPLELEKLGYETSFVGKLHLGDSGNKPILKEYRAGHKHFIGYQCYNGFLDNVYFYDEDGNEIGTDKHRTDFTTDIGIERLKMLAKKDKPFLHTIFYQAPHYPEQPSEKYEELYDGFEVPLPEEYQEIDPYTQTYSPSSPKPFEKCKDYQRYGNNIQKYLQLYYAMVSQIDDNVGRILDELERLGIADDTMIIFSSDHGDMQGSHGMKNKGLPFDRSCGTPLIVYIPNMKQVSKIENPVSAVDFYPTCMEIAGGKSEKNLPGTSLISLINGTTKTHPAVFAEHGIADKRWFMYRDDQFKLVIDRDDYSDLYLFDMINDNTESKNLIHDEKYSEIKNNLKSKLLNIIK